MLINAHAWDAFYQNMEDVNRLIAIHKQLSGPSSGRKHGVEVLNKSAVVLITACWEAFCEDLCIEAFDFLLAHTKRPDDFPVDVRVIVGRALKAEKDERQLWEIAGEGWRNVLKSHREETLNHWVGRLNTPKTVQVDDLFRRTVGIRTVSNSWYWPGMARAKARTQLDRWIALRGAIAHRGQAARSIRKTTVIRYVSHVERIVSRTTVCVAQHVANLTKAWTLFKQVPGRPTFRS